MELLQLWQATQTPSHQPYPPSDLIDLFVKTKKIKRFVSPHYANGIFKDTVYDHTMRCIRLANSLDKLNGDHLEECVRTLWVHDIVELAGTVNQDGSITDFTTADIHYNPALFKMKGVSEVEFANKHFSSIDYHRFMAFERASEYLCGQSKELPASAKSALVAKVIDTIEGDLTFHRSLTKYCDLTDFLPTTLPPGEVMILGLKRCQQARERLTNINSDETILARWLLEQADLCIRHFWLHERPGRYVPAEVKRFFH